MFIYQKYKISKIKRSAICSLIFLGSTPFSSLAMENDTRGPPISFSIARDEKELIQEISENKSQIALFLIFYIFGK